MYEFLENLDKMYDIILTYFWIFSQFNLEKTSQKKFQGLIRDLFLTWCMQIHFSAKTGVKSLFES